MTTGVLQGFTLDAYLKLCAQVTDVDVALVRHIAVARSKSLHGSFREPWALEDRWYASVALGDPDYTIYDGDEYLGEAWACWQHYSRDYLRALRTANLLPRSPELVVDLGCGSGITTAALRELFPKARIIGTNRLCSKQAHVAQLLGVQHGFTLVEELSEVGQPADLVFASEYFEHFPAPATHLREVLVATQPRALVVANAFTAISAGHFPRYHMDGTTVLASGAAALFNRVLKRFGYEQLETNFWNHRPAIWQRGVRNGVLARCQPLPTQQERLHDEHARLDGV